MLRLYELFRGEAQDPRQFTVFIFAALCVLVSHSTQAPLLSKARNANGGSGYGFKPQNLIYTCQLIIAVILVTRFKSSGRPIFNDNFTSKKFVHIFFIRGLILLVHFFHIYALQFTPVFLLQGLGYTEIVWVIFFRHMWNLRFPAENAFLAVISIIVLCGLYTCDMDGSGSFLTTEMFLFAFGNPACMALAQFLTYTNLKTENIREAFDNAAVLSLTDLFWSFILNCGDPIPFRGCNAGLVWLLLLVYIAMYLSADVLTIINTPEVFTTLKYCGNMISILLTVDNLLNWHRIGLLVVICTTCINYQLNQMERDRFAEFKSRSLLGLEYYDLDQGQDV